jgi:OOP family OmpA-OmpF porin
VARSVSVSGVFEYASRPLVLNTEVDGDLVRAPLLSDLFGMNVLATGAPHERVAVAMNLPVWFTSTTLDGPQGAAFGDLRLSVPVGLVLADRDGLAVSVVPFLDLPTGSEARFLGNQGVGGGALGAVGLGWGRFTVDGNLGFVAKPSVDLENLGGGANLVAALGGAMRLSDAYAVRAETYLQPNLSAGNSRAGTETPGELAASFRGRYEDGLSWTAGMGAALTPGAGASPFRAFLGMGYTWGKGPDDPDLDGIVGAADACPREPEVVNGFADDDGCPDDLADLALSISNEDGEPVNDADVRVDGSGVPTLDGVAAIDDLRPDRPPEVQVLHPWYAEWHTESLPLAEGPNAVDVVLDYLPGSLRVHAVDMAGQPVTAAMVRLQGPEDRDAEPVGDDGTQTWGVRPGAWRVLVSADGYATERADVEMLPGAADTLEVRVVLPPARVEVQEAVVAILEKIHFDLDKALVMPESLPLLREVANTLLVHDELQKVEIGGHTDLQGPDKYNAKLSQRRVESVMTYLVAQGVDPSRLSAVGYGESKPVATGDSEETHAANRRVQFSILERAGE